MIRELNGLVKERHDKWGSSVVKSRFRIVNYLSLIHI